MAINTIHTYTTSPLYIPLRRATNLVVTKIAQFHNDKLSTLLYTTVVIILLACMNVKFNIIMLYNS